MNNYAYALMFDIDDALNYSDIHNKITSMPNLYSWFHYLRSSYILISSCDNEELAENIRKIIPNKRFLIFKVDLSTRHGWLPREAWDWIEKMRSEIE